MLFIFVTNVLKITQRGMMSTEEKLASDIGKVNKIPIVPMILDVICKATGMGFAAIARVTQDRWIACSVQDDINFGLVSGSELEIETTICNEIRDSQRAVVIDNVGDSDYVNHHTPRIYGFKSYISVPIFLKNGEFFGTLCAIDPNPAKLSDAKIIGMFNLFTDLIAYHLQSIDLLNQSNFAVQELSRQLTHSTDENRQYKHISDHNLQEPLRKIRMFSDMLIAATESSDLQKAKELAVKVSSSAQRFSMMIKDLSEFSELDYKESAFETVDLNKIITDVCVQLNSELRSQNAILNVGFLPSVPAIPLQLEQLFFHLISNALKFSRKDRIPVIDIFAREIEVDLIEYPLSNDKEGKYFEITLKDNGIGIEQSQLEKIFDIFAHLPYDQVPEGKGIGLSYCRKIIRNHGGVIKAHSDLEKGTLFSIILPVRRITSIDLVPDNAGFGL